MTLSNPITDEQNSRTENTMTTHFGGARKKYTHKKTIKKFIKKGKNKGRKTVIKRKTRKTVIKRKTRKTRKN